MGHPNSGKARAHHAGDSSRALVGFDAASYRLGYGGGYFDRTLAALAPRPFAIGVGFEFQRLETIHPQPFDIPMDWILTEAGNPSTNRTMLCGG
jgi:5-formyltetrahydrofolate cyclo-ligase